MWRVVLVGMAVLLLVACGEGGTGTTGRALSVTGDPLVTRPPGGGSTLFVAGRVKNEAARPYSGQVTVTLFDAAGKIVGTCIAAVNDVPPGDEVTYQAMGIVPEAATWTKVEPKVTLQIPR